MNAKRVSFEDSIERENVGVDWNALAKIHQNEEKHQILLVSALLGLAEETSESGFDTLMHGNICLGPVSEELSDQAVSHIHELFLKDSESKDIIKNLQFITKDETDGSGTPWDVIYAEMDFVPSVLRQDLEQTRTYLKNLIEEKRKGETPVLLSDLNISFDDKTAVLGIGSMLCPLPTNSNERALCGFMFSQEVGVPVDWSLVYGHMQGIDPMYDLPHSKKPDQEIRSTRDTMRRINDKVKQSVNTQDDLFTWEDKTIRRNY